MLKAIIIITHLYLASYQYRYHNLRVNYIIYVLIT